MLLFRKKSAMSKFSSPPSSDLAPRKLWPSIDDFQSEMLAGVSRTFALTIPQLPASLCRVVSNAYLLCRIVDTIEDEPALTGARKNYFCQQFLRTLNVPRNAETFSRQLCASLSSQTPPAEQELIRHVPRVVRITRSFSEPQREALQQCIRAMAKGMGQFQLRGEKQGLQSLEDLDQYCYYVAGVVGQMLTHLFCLHSPQIAQNRTALMALAVSFGQGLQMTNILKDMWEDYRRGACWLPRKIFAEEGFDLSDLSTGRNRPGLERGVRRLIGTAHAHLKNALSYSLLIPKQETGIRNFCLWAIGLAVLTLRKINNHPHYTDGSQVKISRLSVKGTILATRLTVQNDRFLKLLFSIAARGLPPASVLTSWSPAETSESNIAP
ncbi:MAG TPA: phytoene/squalene synthase family protein [Candidatus Binatia bacterium]|jgi:farnesyl-diphosphate farnesyltransferase|nr:phytoene/squalene synthase family protein [Candidatus Binatia bacterium]